MSQPHTTPWEWTCYVSVGIAHSTHGKNAIKPALEQMKKWNKMSQTLSTYTVWVDINGMYTHLSANQTQ